MAEVEPQFLEAPVQTSARELRHVFDGLQGGVFDPTDLEVIPGPAGTRTVLVNAGAALVYPNGGVTDEGRYRIFNDAQLSSAAFQVGGITANSSGLPRIDQVVARMYNHEHDGSGLRIWRLEIVTGTPTAGATLDNRNGAAALPARSLRLADLMVANGSVTIGSSDIRDRRTWARGAFFYDEYAGGNFASAISPSQSSLYSPRRIELSGAPLTVRMNGHFRHASAAWAEMLVLLDGATHCAAIGCVPGNVAAQDQGMGVERCLRTPAAGSHVFEWRLFAGTAVTWLAASGFYLTTTIEENLGGSSDN